MSRFISENHPEKENLNEIDFEDAIRLPDGGTTCEIYRTKWHRHEVFVKRLKEEYRTNPLYLDALDKEYEVGAGLKHPSLPDYREFHRDYIVMDYVDGQTLADMIKNQDPWLRNEKNILRMLRDLIEVADYLHRHHVTHCDIKPDNIMITSNNKNLVLIDLDKCYTDSLNDSSGDPSKYGLSKEHEGRTAIDFRGIARVVEILKDNVAGFNFSRYSAFEKECNKPDPSTDDLLQILEYKPGKGSRRFYWMVTFAPFFVALIYGAVLLFTQGKNGYEDDYGIDDPAPQMKDTIETALKEPAEETGYQEEKRIEAHSHGKEEPAPQSQEQIHARAQVMAARLDKSIMPYFDELNASLENLETMRTNPEITPEKFSEALTTHMDKEDEYSQEAFEILKETYPDLTDREAWRVMAYSKAYSGYKQKAASFLKTLQESEYSRP
ncbi:MAG: protein kinase [Muribaculaceae bacterium]|nr:protein kinase [Muribaculaceae bacterium]